MNRKRNLGRGGEKKGWGEKRRRREGEQKIVEGVGKNRIGGWKRMTLKIGLVVVG